jgi:hypothetical protein
MEEVKYYEITMWEWICKECNTYNWEPPEPMNDVVYCRDCGEEFIPVHKINRHKETQ